MNNTTKNTTNFIKKTNTNGVKKKETFRILAKNRYQSNNTLRTKINNNDIIVGPSGAGKTRGYVLPNILQANESMVVADTKGNLARKLAPFLEKKGYRIRVMDFKDLSKSIGFNPLDNIRYNPATGRYSGQDIIKLVRCLSPSLDVREPFWDEQGRTVLAAMIGYVLENCRPEDRNLVTVQKLFSVWDKDNVLRMFAEVERKDPESFALSKFNMIKNNFEAEKMHCSIMAFTAQALDIFTLNEAKKLVTNKDKVNFRDLGNKKTALFLNISDTDRSMDKLVNIVYTQALQILCDEAEKHPDCRLPVPVRFILDDFATNAKVPDFDKIISVIRSRDIYVSIILQSITQLDALYGDANAKTIINNCDTMLYLGGQDMSTVKLIAEKANVLPNTILNMNISDAYLFIRGKKPELTERFDVSFHPEYAKAKAFYNPKQAPDPGTVYNAS